MSAVRDTIDRHALTIGLCAVWVTTAALGVSLRAPMATEFAALAALIPLALWAVDRHPTCAERKRLLWITALPVAALFLAAVTSNNPRQAILGGEPLYQGWMLWAVLYGWFALVLLGARATDLLATCGVLATGGTVVSLWAFAESLGWVPSNDPLAAAPMAMFDNPNSLAQVLVLSITATAALLCYRRRLGQWALPALVFGLIMQISALLLTHSMAGIVGMLVAAVLFVLMRGAASGSAVIHKLAAATLVGFVGIVLAAFLASAGLLGAGALRTANQALSQRPEIWESASERVVSSPLLGVGPGAFESLSRWNVLPNGDISYVVTYDPHGLAIGWLVSAGVLGLLTFTAAGIKIGLRLAYAAQLPGASNGAFWLIAGVAGCGIAMLTSWPEPLALVGLSVVVGAVIAKSIDPTASPRPRRAAMTRFLVPASTMTAVAAMLLVAFSLSMDAEYDALHGRWQNVQEEIVALQDEQTDTGDPFYTEALFSAVMTPGTGGLSDEQATALIRNLDGGYDRRYSERVDLPLLAAEILWIRRDALSAEEYWMLSKRFAERGRAADPTLSVWDFVEARAAVSAGRGDADMYVNIALANDESPTETRGVLDTLIADSEAKGLPVNVVTDPDIANP